MAYENIVSVPSNATSGQTPVADGNGGFAWGNIFSVTTVTIATSDWSSSVATKSVSGVTSSNNILVVPDPSSYQNAMECGVYCSAQGSGTLTFSALYSTPQSSITMNILIM